MVEKDVSERRVYVLPAEQIERIRAFQSDMSLASEVEAVRRLLDIALQGRDTLDDILDRLGARFLEERDLRILARDVLTTHPLVKTVGFDDGAVDFSLANGERGRIEKTGMTYVGDGFDHWQPQRPRRAKREGKIEPAWDPPKSNLDDEIPF